jgi:hypothetical protein
LLLDIAIELFPISEGNTFPDAVNGTLPDELENRTLLVFQE